MILNMLKNTDKSCGEIGKKVKLAPDIVRKIGKNNNISDERLSIRKNGILERILKKAPYIIYLYNNTNKTSYEISEKIKLPLNVVKDIGLKNSISKERIELRKNKMGTTFPERDKKIVALVETGKYTLASIGKKFGITNERVRQIAQASGIKIQEKNKKEKIEIVKKLIDESKNFTVKQLQNKYKKKNWTAIDAIFKEKHGCCLRSYALNNRNQLLTEKYKKHIAKEVVDLKIHGLKNPNKVTHVNDVYRISAINGYRKYPMIKNRHLGGGNENKKVIKKIVHLHENKGLNFDEIADKLNSLGLTTLTGIKFLGPNTRAKYLQYKKDTQ